jgi:hypothetical protein
MAKQSDQAPEGAQLHGADGQEALIEPASVTVGEGTADSPRTAPRARQEPAGAAPGTAVDTIDRAAVLALLKPHAIPFVTWAGALMEQATFEEEASDQAGLGIIASILTAATSAETFAAMDMYGADRLVGDEPGGRSPLLEITGAIPLESTFDEGPSCFAIFSAVVVETGESIQFSCGARAVQASVMKHMFEGWMPLRAFLVRRKKPTRKGFYPLNLEAP